MVKERDELEGEMLERLETYKERRDKHRETQQRKRPQKKKYYKKNVSKCVPVIISISYFLSP